MGPTGCSETSVTDYQSTLRNIPEEQKSHLQINKQINIVEPGYNDIGLCDTPPIASDILWYQLIPRCQP